MTSLPTKLLLTSAAALIAVPLSTTAWAQDDSDADFRLEEIVVTAERRAARLQEVPVSVSAFTSFEMERRQINSTLDLVRNVPNLVGSNNVGISSATSFFLRGVGQDESLSTSDPAVGTYVDGVYVSRQIANNNRLYDIERIEVLRGPQGTLYGRNTSGGAIKIITRKPGPEPSATFDLGYGSYRKVDFTGRANFAVSDTVYVSLSGFIMEQDKGFSRNITLNKRVNDRHGRGMRGVLRWVPSDTFEAIVALEWSSQNDRGVQGSNALGTTADKLFVVQSGLDGTFNRTDQIALTINATWETPYFTLNSISGYRDLNHDFILEFSDLPEIPAFAPVFVIDQNGDHVQYSQEFQASGDSYNDRFHWVAGAFFMRELNDNFRKDILFGGTLPLIADFQNNAASLAFFGQGTMDLTDQISITAGGRWTRDKKTIDIQESLDIGFLLPLFNNADLEALGIRTRPTFKKFTPHAGIQFQATDDLMAYFSYTQGFKSGGWNARGTSAADFLLVDSEVADSLEAGFKSEWLDRRVRLNFTAFRTVYKDFIITALNPATGGFVTINAAKARIQGIEAELSVRPAPGLDIYASLGTLNDKYTKLAAGVIFPKSNTIKRTPSLSAQVGFNWVIPLTAEQGAPGIDLTLSADYSHQDKYFNGVVNSPSELAEATNLIHAAISFGNSEGDWELTLACENCTDQEYHTSTLDFGVLGFATQFPGEPATVSASLKLNY